MGDNKWFEFDEGLFLDDDESSYDLEELENVTDWESGMDAAAAASIPPTAKKPKTQRKRKETRKPDTSRIPCPREQCLKTFANASTLNAHLKRHEIAGFSARFPQASDISNEEMNVLITSALDEVIKTSGEFSEEVKEYCIALKTAAEDFSSSMLPEFLLHHFHNVLKASKAALSTGLVGAFLLKCNTLMNSSDFVFGLKEELKKICVWKSESVVNIFLGKLFHEVSKGFLVFIVKKLHNLPDYVPSSRSLSKDKIDSNDFKQVIFYVGGSILHKFLKLQKRFPKNLRLHMLGNLLKEKFQAEKVIQGEMSSIVGSEQGLGGESEQGLGGESEQDLVGESEQGLIEESDQGSIEGGEQESEDNYEQDEDHWTRRKDRGGLMYITKDAHQFFSALADFVLCCETESGQLLLEDVYGGVLKTPHLLSLWDKLLGENIEETVALDCLQCVCEAMTNCARRGILKRRLHASLRSVFSSVSLRHSLAKNK